MHIFFKCKELGSRQRHTRRRNTLDSRVIGKIDEEDCSIDRTRLAEGLNEEVRFFERNTHRSEDNGERIVRPDDLRLSRDLCREVGVRKTGSGENRQLLSADQCVQSVNGGDAGLNELGRILAGRRIHRQTVDVASLLRKDLRTVVDRTSQTVKDTAQHVL